MGGSRAHNGPDAWILNKLMVTAPANESQSSSGSYFTPEQQAFANQLMGQQTKLFDLISGRLGGTSGGTGTGGELGGGGDFASYFDNISGGMGPANFTDIPVEDVITPQMLNEQMNNLFAGAHSTQGMGELGLFNARPGMAVGADRAGQNAAMLQAGTRAGIATAYANKIPSLMFQNQAQRQQAMGMQTNVENSRLNGMLQQGQLAAGVRGQDIQNQLGQGRLDVDREGNLLRTLSGFGGGGGGGFLQPLNYSQSTSSSGPAGYLRGRVA